MEELIQLYRRELVADAPSGMETRETAQSAPESGADLSVAVLTRALARGDEPAFRQFYAAYFDRLLRYLLVVCAGDETAAREALQQTLVRVVRHVKPMETEAQFWNWLTVLARSARADESRRQRRYLAFLARFTRQQETGKATPTPARAEDRLQTLLATQLAKLPPAEQQLLTEKYLDRRSVRDIATGEQITEKAVESRLTRIRRKLKTAILAELKNESTD
ncbi:MAG TPA: sigma-70 family RNA polymerase sigma factor [Dongiaceae bacterium]|nr:sigma-70 family RNA polymerase sigma factor [Dongiaceae bacterium]